MTSSSDSLPFDDWLFELELEPEPLVVVWPEPLVVWPEPLVVVVVPDPEPFEVVLVGFDRSVWSSRSASMVARCPPAEPPHAPIRFGSILSVSAFVRM